MNQMKVATHVLNGRRVGYFVDLVTLGSAETMEDIGGHLIVTTPAGTCEGSFMATVMGS